MAVLTRACVVLAVAVRAPAFRLGATNAPQQRTAEAEGVDSATPGPEPRGAELGKPMAFDRLGWTPSCEDLELFAVESPEFKLASTIKMTGLSAQCVHARDEQAMLKKPTSSAKHSGRKPLNFLHISKSGGTFLCNCGTKNGRNRGLPSGAWCHFLPEDRPFWERKGVPPFARNPPAKTTCQSVAQKMRSRGIDLEGNENYLIHGSLCPEFENILIMREPIQRLVSHLIFIGVNLEKVTVDDIFSTWPRLSDNYVSRMLGGESVQDLPLGDLPSSLLQRARHTLHEFDTVFVVSENLTQEFEYAYGWNCSNVWGMRNSNTGGTSAAMERLKARWTSEDWRRLIDQNAMDLALFKDAQLINFVQVLTKEGVHS